MMSSSQECVKINLGCGNSLARGWTGYDSSPNALLATLPALRKLLYWLRIIDKQHFEVSWPKGIRFRNLERHGLPHVGASVDVIYSSHFFEHISKTSGDRLLQECYRVLKPNGILRIAVPDLYANAKSYVTRYERWSAAETGPTPAQRFLEALNGLWGKPKRRSYHRYMYDAQSLAHALRCAGFRETRRCDFKESRIPDIAEVETRQDSLYMEAIKTGAE